MKSSYLLSIVTLAAAAALPLSTSAQMSPDDNSANSVDRQFVQQAMLANAQEIKSADAERNSSNSSVRLFARTMIRDHGQSAAQLAAIANQLNIKYPRANVVNVAPNAAAPPPSQPSSGTHHPNVYADADRSPRAYMQDEIADHQKAISLYENEMKNGNDQDLKTYASKTLPLLKNHLTMAQQYMTVGRITPEPRPTPCTTSYSC